MTSEPKAPGAPAIYLYRQVDRNDQTNFEENYVRIKILTEEGRKQGDVEILYFAHEVGIHNIRARTIHPDGTIINFTGKVYDKTVVKAGNLKYAAKTFTLPDVQVGSIIEYRYTVQEEPFLIFNSHWVLSEDLFTRRAKFSVKLYTLMAARWQGQNLPPGAALPKSAPDRVVKLEVNDVPAFVEEEFSPPDNEIRATVDFVYTENNEFDKVKFWKTEDRRLCDKVESFVGKHKELAQAAAEIAPPGDPPEIRMQKLYAKVQTLHNTSFEPEKTEQEEKREKRKGSENIMDVWKRGSGSGLELTWLYLGLLRAAGFQPFPVAIAHRDRHFFTPDSLNSNWLNDQVILVKGNGADKFLDPGTAFTPFGLLPWSETEVNGFMLDKDAGVWVHTPIPASSDSRILRKAVLKLDTQGTLSGKLTLTFTGLEALEYRLAERNEDEAQRKTYLERTAKGFIPVGSEVELTNKPDWSSSSPELVAEFNLKIPGWVTGAGHKALMPVGVFSNAEKYMFQHASRTADIYFRYPYQTEDDVAIELPSGWHVTSAPAAQQRDLKMFFYGSSVEQNGGTLHLARRTALNGVYVGAKNYSVVRAFYQFVKNSDEQEIVIAYGDSGSQE